MLSLVFSAFAAMAGAVTPTASEVLFVGNSLTYVGNLPAVFVALAAENGKTVQTGMIVAGGATLTQWLDSGAVERALNARHYGHVVLQERGGDFACGFGPKVCRDSRHALRQLSRLARSHHAVPVLLGTYQPGTAGSARIEHMESTAAAQDGVPYIAISKRWLQGRDQFPAADWNWTDSMHPGHALVLLEAVLLYRQLYGAMPQAKALEVYAPMFVPDSQFAPPNPVSLPLLSKAPPADGHDYSSNDVANAIRLAGGR